MKGKNFNLVNYYTAAIKNKFTILLIKLRQKLKKKAKIIY